MAATWNGPGLAVRMTQAPKWSCRGRRFLAPVLDDGQVLHGRGRDAVQGGAVVTAAGAAVDDGLAAEDAETAGIGERVVEAGPVPVRVGLPGPSCQVNVFEARKTTELYQPASRS
jgi:hypothetical protein